MNQKEQLKADRERAVFSEFCAASGLRVESNSIISQPPPKPDIACRVGDCSAEFELVEITDEVIASSLAESFRTGDVTGGAFSQDEPLVYAFESKHNKTYQASWPLNLLAYYDKQYPWSYADPTFIPETVGAIADAMVKSQVWSGIWVYDTWEHKVLWKFP